MIVFAFGKLIARMSEILKSDIDKLGQARNWSERIYPTQVGRND